MVHLAPNGRSVTVSAALAKAGAGQLIGDFAHPLSRLNRPTVRNGPGLGTRERGPCGGAGRGVDAQARVEAFASKDVLGRPAVEQRGIVCT